MTYFNYKHIRGTRSEEVYAGSTILGQVSAKVDWRSRLTVSPTNVTYYCAVGVGGDALPGLFLSRHDAAEALHAVAHHSPDPGAAVVVSVSTVDAQLGRVADR